MQSMEFSIPVSGGKAFAKLFQASGGSFGLTLIDAEGLPVGNGRTLTSSQARELARTLEHCKPRWRLSLVWAALGYKTKLRKPVASAMCHPGGKAFSGDTPRKPAPRNAVLGVPKINNRATLIRA